MSDPQGRNFASYAPPQTVLIIDDNANNLSTLSDYLLEYNFEVLIARNGEQGIARAQLVHPDLILLDIVMPGIDGFETCRRLKADPDMQAIPVIFMTALSDTEHKVKGFELGAVDYITKPLQREEVLARVLTHLRLHALTNRLEQTVHARTIELMETNRQLQEQIAERKRVEAALRNSEAKYRQLVEYANDGIVIMQQELIKYSNRYLLELTGYTLVEVQGRPFSDFIAPDELAKLIDHYERHLAGEDILPIYESVLCCRDGRHIEVELNVSVTTYEGQPAEQVIIRDITVRKQVEAERERLLAQIQQQDRLAAVGQLAAGIVHDFNNIMATITLYAQVAARAPEITDRIRERMLIINQQAQHATNLIRQILDFSRKAEIEPSPLDLLSFLERQIQLFKRTLPENINITFQNEPGTYQVSADPTSMQQMLMNLVVNARDAMPEGGDLQLRLAHYCIANGDTPLIPQLGVGDWIRMDVSDSGLGMPAEVRAHLFEPFFTTKPLGKGTGLGLAQVHSIVTAHGGEITVTSELGRGTTFTFYLPALASSMAESSLATESSLMRGNDALILVVEDDASARGALVESLKFLGYRTLEATNGEQALSVLAQHDAEVALILSDVVMPSMGGMALVQALRERRWKKPVLLVTGHPLREELRTLQPIFPVDWISKPPTVDMLATKVARLLGN
ncbi:MAG: response regulator [Anaerolineae bacterium]|nr:response regulator [Anaerolineae bacterium]